MKWGTGTLSGKNLNSILVFKFGNMYCISRVDLLDGSISIRVFLSCFREGGGNGPSPMGGSRGGERVGKGEEWRVFWSQKKQLINNVSKRYLSCI